MSAILVRSCELTSCFAQNEALLEKGDLDWAMDFCNIATGVCYTEIYFHVNRTVFTPCSFHARIMPWDGYATDLIWLLSKLVDFELYFACCVCSGQKVNNQGVTAWYFSIEDGEFRGCNDLNTTSRCAYPDVFSHTFNATLTYACPTLLSYPHFYKAISSFLAQNTDL